MITEHVVFNYLDEVWVPGHSTAEEARQWLMRAFQLPPIRAMGFVMKYVELKGGMA